jgi:Tol biopolymer transport system component/DNA-binding winged helix-turn-helix (wHTH) protein
VPEPTVTTPESSNIRFGVFEANLRAAELRRNGHKIKLQDQPFQLLAMLLERPGELIHREELRTRLWPVDTFVDFDHGLNAAIKRLRDALGDSADNPRFIETLARRGYRFIAPVTPALTTIQRSPVAAAPARRAGWVVPWRLAAATLLVLLFGTGAGWVAARHFNPKVQIAERRLTANPPDDPILNAVISPDAKYLAFADRSGLFLRVVATGETHSVPLPEGFKPQPAGWFRDGSNVLLTKSSDAQEAASMWTVSVLGGPPRKLMDNAEARSVSPDGSQIAFVRGDVLREEIWLMSSDGENPRRVFGEPGDMFGSVVWSPDGRLLAFVRFTYGSGFKEAQTSLWIVNPQGGLLSLILSDPRLGEALAWSPAGRLIYSLAEPRPNQGDSNLWAICIDPRNARPTCAPARITSGPDKKLRLSLTADGKQLTFLRWRGEPHVYVADVNPAYDRISPPQPLSLDEGRNLPFTWTPDGKNVVFTSDRDGPTHVFKQAADQPAPDLLVGGPDSVQTARLSPNGSELFYLVAPSAGDPSGLSRLMRMPVSGGTPQLILSEPHLNNFQCARMPSKTCIFSRLAANGVSFVAFDPVTGKEKHFVDAQHTSGSSYNWSFSPDGSTIALAEWRRRKLPSEIQLLSVASGASRSISLPDWAGVSSIDWASDGRSLWVSAINPAGTQALLNVDLHGHARPLLQDTRKDVGWVIPSLDGRRIAFWEAGGSSNAWLLDGF